MLDAKTIKKITEFVYAQPRTIQEIAFFLNVNWRTADRYINKIIQETGTLSTRTFREGTRGALKLVHYNNVERIANTEFQERLVQRILAGRKKEDFSPLDIYQYVDPKKRKAYLEIQPEEFAKIERDVVGLLRSAQKQIFLFSGNLSLINAQQGTTKVITVFREVAEAGVSIKVLTRVDIASIKNLELIQEINEQLGHEAIEVRHAEQPLRCIIIDDKHARFKEVKNPETYKTGELKNKTYLFYDIYDHEWLEWLHNLFWRMFRSGIPLQKRLDAINSVRKVTR